MPELISMQYASVFNAALKLSVVIPPARKYGLFNGGSLFQSKFFPVPPTESLM